MTLTLESPVVSIPLQGLPIAAAALDLDGTIVASNHRFDRLCAWAQAPQPPQHLTEVVVEEHRRLVIDAFSTLNAPGIHATRGCRIKALRARPPGLWLAIDLVRLGPDAAVPYLACAHAVANRRRDDAPSVPGRASSAAAPQTGAVVRPPGAMAWSTQLITRSRGYRGPLAAIRGWAQMAARGGAPARMPAALLSRRGIRS